MILVLDNETDPEHRYLGRAIADRLPDAEYRVYVEDPGPVAVADVDGVVLTGSSASVYEDGHGDWLEPETGVIEECVGAGTPLLGVCFGHQLVNHALGGRVAFDERRVGFVEMTDYEADPGGVLAGVDPLVPVIHGDVVVELGDGMRSVGRTRYDPNFCARHASAPVWTVQFHPEMAERFVRHLSSWPDDDRRFDGTNAVRVLDLFAEKCGDADRGGGPGRRAEL